MLFRGSSSASSKGTQRKRGALRPRPMTMRLASSVSMPNWSSTQLGIETELANRIVMGRGLKAPRFRWVPFDDALLLPLNNISVAHETPDRKFFYSREK